MYKILSFICVVVLLGAAGTAQAYTVTITNEMNSTDGRSIEYQHDMDLGYWYHAWNNIQPGETRQKEYSGISAGVCFKKFRIRINQEFSGCEAGNLANRWVERTGTWCENVHVKARRDGCNLILEVERQGW